MRVSVDIIEKMKPCKSRFNDNFLVHYPNFDDSLQVFLSLDKISYSDKIWIVTRLLNKSQLVHWAALCAQSVLTIYESRYPNDKRINNCIKYLLSITDFTNLTDEQRNELDTLRNAAESAESAESARSAAAWSAAAWSAKSAAYAAKSAAESAESAAESAESAAESAAWSAAYAARSARSAAEKEQEDLNLKFLLIASNI